MSARQEIQDLLLGVRREIDAARADANDAYQRALALLVGANKDVEKLAAFGTEFAESGDAPGVRLRSAVNDFLEAALRTRQLLLRRTELSEQLRQTP